MSGHGYKRSARVAQSIHQVLAATLNERVSDPRLRGVMITEVALNDDIRSGKVYWYFLTSATDSRIKKAEQAFRSASRMLRSQIGSAVRLKHVPELSFVYDKRIDHARHIEALLDEVRPQDDAEGPDTSGTE